MPKLVLVRHGESLWNAQGLWTGLTDIGLSEKGKEEARSAGELVRDIKFQTACTSVLKRAKETLSEIEAVLEVKIPTFENTALNERDYGDYTGKNKWQIKEQLGEENFLQLRRSWDYPIPNGESLKDVYARVIPYYQNHILPELKNGKNVLVSAHGNSLRALIKYLENISDEKIPNLELATGEIYIYSMNNEGVVINKEIKKV